jgi:hypothetical protein
MIGSSRRCLRDAPRAETQGSGVPPDAMQGSQAHSLFRWANEQLVELVRANGLPGNDVPFLCECADASCFGRVTMSLDEFDRLCASGGLALEPGHERRRTVKGLP